MRRLLLLVDSRRYIRSNCYQRQLAATLQRNFTVTMVSARELRLLPYLPLKRYDCILSVLRLRTLVAILPALKRLLRGRSLHIYEQDVWQAFMDESPWRGAYQTIAAELKVEQFLVTSQWWSEIVSAHGLPVQFVRMGMLPELCSAGPEWDERSIRLGFQGTLHPHRREFYEELGRLGVEVEVLASTPYEQYLENLQEMRIYVHTEASPWLVDGKLTPRNALWIKETEVAARGTFVMRDHEDESEAYAISELPTVYTFRDVTEVPKLIAEIEGMDPVERRNRMVASAENMRQRDDWMTVVRALEQ